MARWPVDPVSRVLAPIANTCGGSAQYPSHSIIKRPAESVDGSSSWTSAPSARAVSPTPVRGYVLPPHTVTPDGTKQPLASSPEARNSGPPSGWRTSVPFAGASLGTVYAGSGYEPLRPTGASSYPIAIHLEARRAMFATALPQSLTRSQQADGEGGSSPSAASTRTAPSPLEASALPIVKALVPSLGASGGPGHPRPPSIPFPAVAPPFYWVPSVDTITEFEVNGAFGEIVSKIGNFEDRNAALPINGTLRMVKGGLYCWTLQIVRLCPQRPQVQFGIRGAEHARPSRLVSTGRCSRARDDGPWLARPSGDVAIVEGDYVHCEADLRGLGGPIGSFSYAVNGGQMETVFEDIPLSEGALLPVLLMGGNGTTCRLCHA